jgi:predicted nucleic acid-binding protein
MTWLLDADVLSQPAKKRGNVRVVAWLDEQKDVCYTSSIVIAQLAFWVRSRSGKQREALQAWLRRLVDAMHGRILGFNVAVAHVWAEQQIELVKAGRRMPVEDSYIAAIARRHNLIVATGNDKDFHRPGIKVFNPFKELP